MFGRRIGTRSGNRLKSGPKSSSSRRTRMQRKAVKNINIEEELNTKTFDEHQSAVWKKIPTKKRKGCICFDPLWYSSYVAKTKNGESNVMYWISIESVFEKRYVFIPLCQANHWNLVILCNLGHNLNSTRSPCILLLDSLHAAAPQWLETEIRRPIVRDFVDDVIVVEDKEIVRAMQLCYEILKVVVEPSGAIGLAAVLSDSFRGNPASKDCHHIGIILSEGNVDLGVLWDSLC